MSIYLYVWPLSTVRTMSLSSLFSLSLLWMRDRVG